MTDEHGVERPDLNYMERAEVGALILDKCYPGWHKVVDIDGLDMSSSYDGVLGRLTDGTYPSAIMTLAERATEHGLPLKTYFDQYRAGFLATPEDEVGVPPIHCAMQIYELYGVLTEAWKDLIRIRRLQDGPK